MLERIMVRYGSEFGLKHGQHPACDPNSHPPLANVLLTPVQKIGVETAKFQDATGTLTGLV